MSHAKIPVKSWPIPNWIPHKPAPDGKGGIERIGKTMLREHGRCIYCDLDLASSKELLLSAELDHLVPQEVFRNPEKPGYIKSGDYGTNLVFCCGPCNDAKANWPLCLAEPESRRLLTTLGREPYLEAAKKFTIDSRRSEEKRVAGLMAKVWAQRASRK